MSQKPPTGELPDVSSGGERRARTVQRLQIGITGVALMVLLIALANVIQDRVAETEAAAVPEPAPASEPTQAPPGNDPLVEAGVVPDLPVEPTATPTAEGAAAPQDVDQAGN